MQVTTCYRCGMRLVDPRARGIRHTIGEGWFCSSCWAVREKARKQELKKAEEKLAKILVKLTTDDCRFLGITKATKRTLVCREMRRHEYVEGFVPKPTSTEFVERFLE